jgi:hypothetical protein
MLIQTAHVPADVVQSKAPSFDDCLRDLRLCCVELPLAPTLDQRWQGK